MAARLSETLDFYENKFFSETGALTENEARAILTMARDIDAASRDPYGDSKLQSAKRDYTEKFAAWTDMFEKDINKLRAYQGYPGGKQLDDLVYRAGRCVQHIQRLQYILREY